MIIQGLEFLNLLEALEAGNRQLLLPHTQFYPQFVKVKEWGGASGSTNRELLRISSAKCSGSSHRMAPLVSEIHRDHWWPCDPEKRPPQKGQQEKKRMRFFLVRPFFAFGKGGFLFSLGEKLVQFWGSLHNATHWGWAIKFDGNVTDNFVLDFPQS